MKPLEAKFLPDFINNCRGTLKLMEKHPDIFEQHVTAESIHSTMPDLMITGELYRTYLKILESPNTKRLLFDARQAEILDRAGDIRQRGDLHIHAPFEQLYCEFTEKIQLQAQEPGYSDFARGFVYFGVGTTFKVGRLMGDGKVIDNEIREVIFPDGTRKQCRLNTVVFFFTSDDDGSYCERTFAFTDDGLPVVSVKAAKRDSNRHGGKHESIDGSVIPPGLADNDFIIAGAEYFPGRRIGWWESSVASYTNLIRWVFAFTMAKSVKIVGQPYSRQLRRACEREQRPLPPEWHICRVEPRYISHATGEGELQGNVHGYRYDVISHMRFNRHKRRDGSYIETVEFVDAHQRGLKHDRYIPKTYLAEKDTNKLP